MREDGGIVGPMGLMGPIGPIGLIRLIIEYGSTCGHYDDMGTYGVGACLSFLFRKRKSSLKDLKKKEASFLPLR